ncbi:SpoIIE family protein phosphatase [uncultured Treponema sp.]|uniref:PP2C family protein-serine/threonine phosphatase n=1 Tax=uncultured Treponema sp. TaxID=162155 RepID=UPI0025D7C117|nr:SpoIIE family protein phosphatase [uncultured Treponema sp.]
MRVLSKANFICFLILLTQIPVMLCSCGKPDAPKLVLGRDFYYWESTADSNPGDAMKNAANFKKLEDHSEHNLMKIFGKDRHYVWIRADFEIPESLKNMSLGLVIPHLRFAEQVWCNGTFISQYGAFPPHEQSTMFKAHFFSFPINILKQEGVNTILIKVFVYGDSGISSHAFIQPTGFAYSKFESINFINARLYMLFFGIMVFTFVLFICLYASILKFKTFRDFALLNFSAVFLLPYFFATELPAYTTGMISHLIFAKFTLCIPGYTIIYLTGLFATDFFKSKMQLPVRIARDSILAIQILCTLFATSYDFLLKISPAMMILVGLQVLLGLYELVRNFSKKETRLRTVQFFIGFQPFGIGLATDLIIRLIDNTKAYPYFTIFGWQGTIIVFIVMLSQIFARIYRNNENLSNHLLEEVAKRTRELEDANNELSLLNEKLEKDKLRSDKDLEMASLVQKNFLPQPNRHFRGWEISVCYAPQAKVSGDLYDYYSFNDILNGLSLFDVSGHGLSASLVTMLSKNIISRVFQTGFRRREPIDNVLTKINNMIISEKGDIDNYMTGVLCRFTDTEDSGKCSVELGNAGHPYPLKFSVHDKEIYELRGNDGKKHYGAIGMKGIMTSFARSNFFMSTGDILILYTDGLTEAQNSKFEQFGIEPIKDIVKKNHARNTDEIAGLIFEKLEEFTEYKPFEDDITLIIAKRKNTVEYVADDEHDDDMEEIVEELPEA